MTRHTIALFSTLLTATATLSACGSGETEFELIETIESQDGTIILEYAPSQLAFGPAEIRIRAGENDTSTVLYEGKISNDGSDITLDNVRPNSSKSGFLWLCLNGVEQEDVAVRIEFSTGIVFENERHCTD